MSGSYANEIGSRNYNYGEFSVVKHPFLLELALQLFQLTLSDQSLKPTQQDPMVVWVEVEGCCTCRILMKCNGFVGVFLSLQKCEKKLFKPQ